MLVTKVSQWTGKEQTLDLPVTEAQIEAVSKGEDAYKTFTGLNELEIEFMLTGVTPEEYRVRFFPTPIYDESGTLISGYIPDDPRERSAQ